MVLEDQEALVEEWGRGNGSSGAGGGAGYIEIYY